jgi:hypothetical protein
MKRLCWGLLVLLTSAMAGAASLVGPRANVVAGAREVAGALLGPALGAARRRRNRRT